MNFAQILALLPTILAVAMEAEKTWAADAAAGKSPLAQAIDVIEIILQAAAANIK